MLISIVMVAVLIFAARTAFLAIAGPVISPALAGKLKVGMSRDEIEAMLGAPAEVHESGEWLYLKRFNPGWATVDFDDRGQFVGLSQELAFP